MHIRPFEASDSEALASLFHASVRQAGLAYYSSEQVDAWSPSKPEPDKYVQQARDRIFLVAVDDDGALAGYGDLEANGHIDHLYCRPDITGQGVGSAIYAALESAAKAAGITTLFVEASEGARRLFERRGFVVEARNDFTYNGVAMHNYSMSKLID
ncbi:MULTISPECIES: GNAT family N-acetyltransferase [unclassified Sphingomonas]|jgi:putative acetyltransferase|uniref:GNAT family N-acetyltransferase n=1 Tax=unclassified Sphingomonas TaxID=196159 RepID=UPI000835940F|nr:MULTISPECIES: GNAT family N-acetyltransferase [unclassified Sphingomonas]MCH4891794.1 GNAT family N-acetyltransferase [Sphingomonas sp. SFZ2018-12]